MTSAPENIAAKLREVCGERRVSVGAGDLEATARDCWPRGLIAGTAPEERALAVVWPERDEEVAELVRLARAEGFSLAPLGAGSGVCGAFWPDPRTVVVDLKRLTGFEVSADGSQVFAGAGLLGWDLEERLARLGKTAGHFPSSILCSTVGGWVAARGAGQCSGRYGKIEDMVTEVRCVLGTGSGLTAHARGGGGPQLLPWLVGSEGSVGIVTRVGLRLVPTPTERAFAAFSFPTFELGQEALRHIYQSGLRPAVARLYDAVDSVLHASSKSGEDVEAEPEARSAGRSGARDTLEAFALRSVLKAPGQLARLVSLLEKQGRAHSRLLLLFENVASPAEQARAASVLCAAHEGRQLGEAPVRQWLQHRYDVSFRQSKVFRAGAFSDTMEVAAPWARLAVVYRAVKEAVGPRVLLMAHVSHCYPDGAAIYFTFVGHGRSQEQSLALYDAVWAEALEAAVRAGATVSHHHGVGRSKALALTGLSGATARRALLAAWDPDGILNPGVFGFPEEERRDPVGKEPELRGGLRGTNAPVEFDEVSQLVDVDASLSLDQVENLLFKRGLSLGVGVAGERSLGDWILAGLPGLPSAWDDPVWRLIAGFSGRLAAGQPCRLRPAPRRAEGPDLTGFFQGTTGALGRLERVTLAVKRMGVEVDPLPGPRPPAVAATPEEHSAFEAVVRTVRAPA